MAGPLVSVVIPAYNAAAFIGATLESVLGQTYPDLEVIVVDDGSTDDTAAIVQSFAARDGRVTLLHQPNSGVAAARNLAITHAKGEFVAPIDADDLWFPDKIEKQVRRMLELPEAGLVYAWSVTVDEAGTLLGEGYTYSKQEGDVFRALLGSNFLGNASVPLIRRGCLDEIGLYDCVMRERRAQGCEDWDLYLRLAERYSFGVVPEFLVGYRQVGTSMSRNFNAMGRSYAFMMNRIEERHPEVPAGAFRKSRAFFYLYLAAKSSESGNHTSSLGWLLGAFRVNPRLLARAELRESLGLTLRRLMRGEAGVAREPRRAGMDEILLKVASSG